MFSLDNFYYVLYQNFLQPDNAVDIWFNEFGSVETEKMNVAVFPQSSWRRITEQPMICFFYDQEPLLPSIVDQTVTNLVTKSRYLPILLSNKITKLLANSEKSRFKSEFCREHKFLDWYYFFHGLAALEWYRDYKYIPKVDVKFTKVFISLNHLMSKDRSYRLNLIANIADRGLLPKGNVSCQLSDEFGDWKTEILSPDSKLSKESKKLVYKHFSKFQTPLILDDVGSYKMCSARLNLPLQQSGLWHIVTETVFYYNKLHLTEKIFKPIVARRPFMLVGAPGNLEYLKSYGFKTFDRWIDERYDHETDHDIRISMIVTELEKLCNLSESELTDMYHDMSAVLDHNFNHFYGDFKSVVVEEMVNNFEACIKQHNQGLVDIDQYKNIEKFDLAGIFNRLMQ